MAFLKKQNTNDGASGVQNKTILSGGGSLGTSTAPSTSAPSSGGVRTPTTSSFVSGEQYLSGNQAGAQKLADQIVKPLTSTAAEIESSARTKALESISAAGQSSFNNDLMDRAFTDAKSLTDSEQTNIKNVLAGGYSGPTDFNFNNERQDVRKLENDVKNLGTVSGLNQSLTNLSGGRKYSTGMRNFDAMLMRQDPSLRTKLNEQSGLGERVTGTLDRQKANVLKGIAAGQDLGAERAVAANKRFADARSGQEQAWTAGLESLRGRVGGLNTALAGEQALSKQQLDLLGLTPEEYDRFRDAYITTSYGYNRPFNSLAETGLGDSPNQLTAADAIKGNSFRNFQLDDFQVNKDDVGYDNVINAGDLAQYQALNALSGEQGAGYIPQTPLTGATGAVDFNRAAASSALQNFINSNVAKPVSDLQMREGRFGTGSVIPNQLGFGAPQYTGEKTFVDSGNNIDPATGKTIGGWEYVGPKSGNLNGTPIPTDAERFNINNWKIDQSVNQEVLNARRKRSGFDGTGE